SVRRSETTCNGWAARHRPPPNRTARLPSAAGGRTLMDQDPMDRIAESYKTLADTQLTLAQTQQRIEATQHLALENQHLALRTLRGLARLQGVALTVLGLSLLGTAVLVWHTVSHRVESAALEQAVLHNTQIIEAHTKAILEQLRQR